MLEKHVDNVPKMAYTIIDIAVKPKTAVYDSPAGIKENILIFHNTLAYEFKTMNTVKNSFSI